jgi:hypothetical protein
MRRDKVMAAITTDTAKKPNIAVIAFSVPMFFATRAPQLWASIIAAHLAPSALASAIAVTPTPNSTSSKGIGEVVKMSIVESANLCPIILTSFSENLKELVAKGWKFSEETASVATFTIFPTSFFETKSKS